MIAVTALFAFFAAAIIAWAILRPSGSGTAKSARVAVVASIGKILRVHAVANPPFWFAHAAKTCTAVFRRVTLPAGTSNPPDSGDAATFLKVVRFRATSHAP